MIRYYFKQFIDAQIYLLDNGYCNRHIKAKELLLDENYEPNIDTNTNLFPSGNPTNTYSSFPEVAPDVFSFTLFTPSDPYPNDNPGYRDILIRGSYDDFKNDTLDYSHNIIIYK